MHQAGTVLKNRYSILKLIGEGGMSSVYLACDKNLHNKLWALKEMAPSGTLKKQHSMKEQFEREAQILCQLKHHNLPQVTDYFIEEESQYLVMEYVEGETLYELLGNLPSFITEEELREWGAQLCDALDYLHSRNPPIIYRDIKPKNIMLTPGGVIKLIDFGIARLFDQQKVSDTIVIGTPGFASPEQFGRAQTDQRSDIYSLGATLYNLATKKDPSDEPFCFVVPSTINIKLTSAFDATVLKALSLKQSDRFQSASEFREALTSRTTAILPFMASPSESSLSLQVSHSRLEFHLENHEEKAEGTLLIENRGRKFLRASVTSNRTFITPRPDYFESNTQEIKILVNIGNERKTLLYEGKILIETEEREIPVEIVINVKPTALNHTIPRLAVSLFLLGQSLVPMASPFTIAYTFLLFNIQEKQAQKFPFYASLAISILHTLHFTGVF